MTASHSSIQLLIQFSVWTVTYPKFDRVRDHSQVTSVSQGAEKQTTHACIHTCSQFGISS